MFKQLPKKLAKEMRKKLRHNRFGQGLTEYTFLIAFIAGLIALVFQLGPGKLASAMSSAFSSTVGQLNNLSSEAASSPASTHN